MPFFIALITTICWGIADLFYKKGNNNNESCTHLKTVVMVGTVMFIHAACSMVYMYLKDGFIFDVSALIVYLPVSAMYIISMALGYFGLRYIELSVASPVQNTSGAIVCVLCFFILGERPGVLQWVSIITMLTGVIMLGIAEKKKSDCELKISGEADKIDKKYKTGIAAFIFPLLYCIFDSLGTFFDGFYLNEEKPILSEENALIAYELTFFICAIVAFIIIRARGEKYNPLKDKYRGAAAVFETAGQVAYVFIIGGNTIIIAPLVASYCIVSVILSRLFLKEKLTKFQLISVITVIAGIILTGICDGLAGEF